LGIIPTKLIKQRAMTTLELTIGQEISLKELTNVLGSYFIEFDKVINGEITNMDNFNGEEGINVYFELIDTSMCQEDDNRFIHNPENAIVKITDIENI
jgi:hypothetical protein